MNMPIEYDAIVVGSGPNGLAAAITLARAGCSVVVYEANATIGGGARSAELTLPGFLHDVCSAVHPLAAGSPFFKTLPLERFGLEWIEPQIPLAHPLDDGSAACLCKDIDLTAEQLAKIRRAYRRLMKPLARNWENLSIEFLQPMLHWPQHPITLAHFGILALCPATLLAKFIFKGERARALFAGIAAHSFLPLEAPVSSAFALVLGLAGHAVGWPIPRGGSQQISNALADYLRELGGKIEVNHRIENLRDLPKSRAILLDVSVWEFLRIAGQQMPSGYRRRLESFRHAPGIFKIDYALSEPIPWKAEACRRAGTIHLGGTSMKLRRRNARLCAEKFPSARLCWSRNKVCSMKRERRVVSTRSGRTAMFRSTAARICRIKSNRRSSDSRPVSAIASSPATRWVPLISEDQIRIWPAATSTAAQQI